jgi:hypothetical protein
MPNSAFRELPLGSLYELLAASVKEMLYAIDKSQEQEIALKTSRRLVETLLEEIDRKVAQKQKDVN